MKNPEVTEGMAEQTARDLFGLVFDEGGLAVPGDDLAPAAMDGYRRYRRWRRAAVGAGATVAMAGVVATAMAVGGGPEAGPAIPPGVVSNIDTTPLPPASASAPGSRAGRVVDCLSQFRSQIDLAKAQADCRRAENLWRAVFPEAVVSGAHEPVVPQFEKGFLARVHLQDATSASLYGRPQQRVLQDWTEARQQDLGYQSWSGFDITSARGTIIVSADFEAGRSVGDLRCGGATPCQDIPLTDGTTAEVSGTGDVHGYQVTVRSANGDAYKITLSGRYDPRYVEVPCSDPSKHCYADLADGSIHPGLIPATEEVIGTPVVTKPVLSDLLARPAFAALVKAYFAERLGQPAAGS